ncbi:hypothetical protein [Oricola sp.]|uniref:hypothetical protein n=1 Tax=Oricola sp. TaxID=1979950 RepID=UPI003BAC4353
MIEVVPFSTKTTSQLVDFKRKIGIKSYVGRHKYHNLQKYCCETRETNKSTNTGRQSKLLILLKKTGAAGEI